MGKLIRDWFGRRQEDSYTFANEDRVLDWDNGRKNLFSYFMTRGSKDNSVSNASKLLGSMFRVLGAKKTPVCWSQRISPDQIQIPIGMLQDEDGNYTDSVDHVDAFYGAAIQNASLKLFQSKQEYQKTITSRNVNRGSFKMKDLLFSVLNSERIDKKLSERYPGYLRFVQKYKDYKYDENYIPLDPSDPAQHRLLDLVTRMLRYPANLSAEEIEEFKKPMEHLQKLLKKYGGIPNNAADCDSMATSIANMIYKYTEVPPPPPSCSEPSGDSESGEPSEPSEDGASTDGDTTEEDVAEEPKSLSKSELDEIARDMMSQLMVEEDSGDPEELDNILNEFKDGMEEFTPKIDYSNEGEASSASVGFVNASKGSQEYYKEILSEINTSKALVLRKLLERKNKDYQFAIKSMRSGRLDGNKIAEAVQGVPTIYERIGEIKTDKICLGVLVDESGSMSGRNIEKARQAAIFINEIFKDSKDVELFIYGHTADCSRYATEITVYRDKLFQGDPYALSNVRAKSNNRDGDAILGVARRMRAQTSRAGVLFVLSDGQPSASGYGGQEAIRDTAKKVKMAEKLGFQVIQIAIEESVPSKEMFTHYVKMTDIANLPNDLTMYLSKSVDKLIKERVTL